MRSQGDTKAVSYTHLDVYKRQIVDRTQGFLDKMVEMIGEGKVSIIGHDKFKKEVADAKVILEIGIPANVVDADCQTAASKLSLIHI